MSSFTVKSHHGAEHLPSLGEEPVPRRQTRPMGTSPVTKGYLEAAQRALWTFHHQRVLDPRALAFLAPTPDTGLVPEQGVALPPLVPLPDGPLVESGESKG